MSLRIAVTTIVETMEQDIATAAGAVPLATFRGYVRELRMALLASQGTDIPTTTSTPAVREATIADHRILIERAREQLRAERGQPALPADARRVQLEESGAFDGGIARMIEAVGGPAAGSLVPTDGNVPEGAHTHLDGGIYTYRDGKWHHGS